MGDAYQRYRTWKKQQRKPENVVQSEEDDDEEEEIEEKEGVKMSGNMGMMHILRRKLGLPAIITALAAGTLVGTQASAIAAIDLLTPHTALWPDWNIKGYRRQAANYSCEDCMSVAVKMQLYTPVVFALFETILYLLDKTAQEMKWGTDDHAVTDARKPSLWRYITYTALGIAIGIVFVWFAPHRRGSVSLYLILSFALFFGFFLAQTNFYLGRPRLRKIRN